MGFAGYVTVCSFIVLVVRTDRQQRKSKQTNTRKETTKTTEKNTNGNTQSVTM
jgi:hypothetical protein